jgi:predicted pyridoxine 5'-phosphate oxidase superfamily flavin-nucleotide-binding protein
LWVTELSSENEKTTHKIDPLTLWKTRTRIWIGDRGRIRTCNPGLTRDQLYPVELRDHRACPGRVPARPECTEYVARFVGSSDSANRAFTQISGVFFYAVASRFACA